MLELVFAVFENVIVTPKCFRGEEGIVPSGIEGSAYSFLRDNTHMVRGAFVDYAGIAYTACTILLNVLHVTVPHSQPPKISKGQTT